MLLYKDYCSLAGKWYTFRPLPLMKREELSRRFNNFDKTISIKEQLLLDDSGRIFYNIKQIFALYNINVEEFTIKELDDVLINYILTVNFEALQYEQPKINQSSDKESDKDILSLILNSTWGVCDSAGDAMYLINNLPADLLLETIRLRSEDLERMYSTEKEKRKREAKKVKEMLIEKAKKRMVGNGEKF